MEVLSTIQRIIDESINLIKFVQISALQNSTVPESLIFKLSKLYIPISFVSTSGSFLDIIFADSFQDFL